jgi:hypothetical protein
MGIPVRLNRIVVGSILPPKGVVEQTTQTIIQEQRKITMVCSRKRKGNAAGIAEPTVNRWG